MGRIFRVILTVVIVVIGIFAISAIFSPSIDTNNPDEPIIQFSRRDVSEVAEDIVETTESITLSSVEQTEQFLNRLVQPPTSTLAQVLFVVAGVVLLIFGWRVYNFIIILAGAWVGATLASAMVVSSSAIVEVAAILIGGFIGAFVAIFVYFIAVFIIGMYVGVILTTSLASAFSLTPVTPIALIIGAVIGGFLLLALSSELVIFISALVGAQMLTGGLGLQREWVILFTIVGIVIQIASTRYYNVNLRRPPRRRWIAR